MFTALPGEGERLAAFYGQGNNDDGNASSQGRNFNKGRWFDFYAANLQRGYGQPCPAPVEGQPPVACPPAALDAARWQSHTLDRMQAWGFNTLGN